MLRTLFRFGKPAFFLILILHLVLLFNLKFTPWPEMLKRNDSRHPPVGSPSSLVSGTSRSSGRDGRRPFGDLPKPHRYERIRKWGISTLTN